jgi:uncharacterized protein involved in propanediol utilization
VEQTGRLPSGIRTGSGWANGTFGELLQGVLAENDMDFLVTLPIAQGATATFQPVPGSQEVNVHPPHKVKAALVAGLIITALGLPCGGYLRLENELAEGKGFASSSADLVATVQAVGDAFGVDFKESEIEDFLRQIEPSDGVMYCGVVAFYHRAVRLRERLGFLPDLVIVAHDEGGEVDTILFNRMFKPFSQSDKAEYSRLLAELGEAVPAGDLAAIGRVATRSARLNEILRPRAHLEAIQQISRDVDGLGVVAAHSGTVLGILLDAADPQCEEKIVQASRSLRALPGSVSVHRTAAARRAVPALVGPAEDGGSQSP